MSEITIPTNNKMYRKEKNAQRERNKWKKPNADEVTLWIVLFWTAIVSILELFFFFAFLFFAAGSIVLRVFRFITITYYCRIYVVRFVCSPSFSIEKQKNVEKVARRHISCLRKICVHCNDLCATFDIIRAHK